MANSRVTPEGLQIGELTSILAQRGRRRLESLGLSNVSAPALREQMCKTCACQPGAVPNGCLQTQMDFLKSVVEGKPFLCHAPLDGKLCAGWVRARAELAAAPIPLILAEMTADWEYSPPDNEGKSEKGGE